MFNQGYVYRNYRNNKHHAFKKYHVFPFTLLKAKFTFPLPRKICVTQIL